MGLIATDSALYPKAHYFISSKRISTRRSRIVCLFVCMHVCMHACMYACMYLAYQHAWESTTRTCISTIIWSKRGIDPPCWLEDRCTLKRQSRFHKTGLDSWDAYAFRPPLPDLNETFLTPSIYMNSCNGENRAAAALFYAGVAGKWHPHTEVRHARSRLHVWPVSKQTTWLSCDSAANAVQRMSTSQFNGLSLCQKAHAQLQRKEPALSKDWTQPKSKGLLYNVWGISSW